MGFADDLKRFAKKRSLSLEQAVTGTLFKLNGLVINRTPVDTGQARGGWIATLGTPSSSQGGKNKQGVSGISNANKTASKAFGKIYWLTNNVKHIRELEYGHSDQAPNGMVRVSIREIQNDIARQVRALNNG